jgi:hypothetical protein
MFPSINRRLASSLQKSDSPAHHKALGAEWTSVSEIRRDAFARAGWEKLVEILAQDFAKDDEQEDGRDYSDLLMRGEEWVDYNMSGTYLEPDAPVIVVSGESL